MSLPTEWNNFLYTIRTNSFGVLPLAKRWCIKHFDVTTQPLHFLWKPIELWRGRSKKNGSPNTELH